MSQVTGTFNPGDFCPILERMASDLGLKEITLGQDDYGADFKVFGATSGCYMLWDESLDSLLIPGTNGKFQIGGFTGAAIGTGSVVSATATAPFKVFADDGGAAIGSGSLVRAGWFRNLQTYTGGNREQEACGVQGSLVSVAGTNRHNMCGVLGSYEARTSLVVDGQISSTDPWIQAGVIGRVGMSSGTLTVNQYGVLAGLAAMSNVNTACTETFTGRFAGLYVGRWASANEFEYAIYAEDVQHGIYMTVDSGTVSGEEHGWELDYTGTLSSGDSLVGLDVVVTTAGTAGTWVSGAYFKVVQGATKNVNGYLSGVEIELTNSADSVSDWFVLVLNAANSGAQHGSHSSYIALRDYGSLDCNSLMWVSTDHTIGTTDGTVLMSSGSDTAATHYIRFIAGSTAYWLLATTTTPS